MKYPQTLNNLSSYFLSINIDSLACSNMTTFSCGSKKDHSEPTRLSEKLLTYHNNTVYSRGRKFCPWTPMLGPIKCRIIFF